MRGPLAIGLALGVVALAGCRNPDASSTTKTKTADVSPQNAGEPAAPPPTSPRAQTPADVQPTPSKAISAFVALYVNWNYRTLVEHQRTLAAISVGAARLSERQAATSSQGDQTIARGRIYNRGQIVSVAEDQRRAGWWVIVTREQTGGNTQYEGLPAAYHVTTAQLATVPGGYAVDQWLPQS
jgi:hypothetical protein